MVVIFLNSLFDYRSFLYTQSNFWADLEIGLLAGVSEKMMFSGTVLGFFLKLMTNKSDSRW